MSMESGPLSFSMFYLRDEINPVAIEIIERLQNSALPDLDPWIGEEVWGWSGPRHILDRDLSPGNIVLHGWVRLQHVKAIRKVSETLLQAECKSAEQKILDVQQREYLSRAERAEIKQLVRERLMLKAQPSLDAIGVWINSQSKMLIAEANTDGKIDRLSPAFKEVFGLLPILATPETTAITMSVNANDLFPVSFSPDVTREAPVEVSLGMEFLTWLFWRYEETGGAFQTRLHGPQIGYMLEGPLTFFHEGRGAHEVGIRKGNPLNSREAISCLLEGKLLKKAKIVMTDADKIWSGTVDDNFSFHSLKLPQGEGMDADQRFAERSLCLAEFLDAWFCLFGLFIAERSDPKKWHDRVLAIRDWISQRAQTRQIGGVV